MSQGPFSPKIRFLGQKVCSVARGRTDGQTQKWQQRTPFQGFRIFSFNLSLSIGPTAQQIKSNPKLFYQYVSSKIKGIENISNHGTSMS